MINPNKGEATNGPNKVLSAPIHLGSMAANLENNVDDMKSIWMMQRDENLVSITSYVNVTSPNPV